MPWPATSSPIHALFVDRLVDLVTARTLVVDRLVDLVSAQALVVDRLVDSHACVRVQRWTDQTSEGGLNSGGLSGFSKGPGEAPGPLSHRGSAD